MKLIFVFVFFGSLAYGHNWMQKPPSFNGNKAKAGNLPCNAETATYTAGTYPLGSTFDVTWTTNHGGDHWVKVVANGDMDSLETLTETDPKMLHYVKRPKPAADAKSDTSTVTLDQAKFTTGSSYVVQYGWSKYRSCARFTVSALVATDAPTAPVTGTPTAAGTVATGSPTGTGIDAVGVGDCNIYCEDFQRQCLATTFVYANTQACLDACALFSRGGQDRDTTGNTFQCRWYHLHPDPGHNPDGEVHCAHASKESTKSTCQGGSFQAGANLLVTLKDGMSMTASKLQGYVEECLAKTGYTDVTVSSPSQANGEWTVQLVFDDAEGGGGSLDQKLKAVKVDTRPKDCMTAKAEVAYMGVAATTIDDSDSRGGPPVILSAVAILLCVLFQ